ncbi:uncharacterized protein LOC131218519 isoform X2 [Magnolia sinica]|uniref:uncharacterized protein LOC131218519 isoform X2 n=1 Tax=Magnolia sinica TaxID=86752 RepID=UPI0026590896|nr:uncharacterized protein LOC131218519 isoform X2 [Magnolia sinica]
MDSDDDLIFSARKDPPSPIHQTKLRRLKKASGVSKPPPVETQDPIPSIPTSDSLDGSDAVEPQKSPDLEKLIDQINPVSGSEGFNEESEVGAGGEARESLDLEAEEELQGTAAAFDEKGDGSSFEFDGPRDGLNFEKFTKKRRSSREGKEKERKKKKKNESIGDEGKPPEVSGRNKRKLVKEREAYLNLIHVESQRLLRETRDASFKPVPIVQKPISSVLEKIRLRKLEVLKKSGISDGSDCLVDTHTSSRDLNENFEPHVNNDSREDSETAEKDGGMHVMSPEGCDAKSADVEGLGFPDSLLSPNESTPSNTELLRESQLSEAEEKQTEDLAESSQEEDAFTPSVLATNLKLDSIPPGDDSSDEEYDDKENVDPHLHKVVDVGLHSKGDPVKAFVDDEAEEEDDGDNDLMRFRENEEDEDGEDNEELGDLIVTGYKEMPIDSERRDELHQKWLEQQDAAATDNVLQRLNCGWKQRDPTLLCEEEDEEELGEDSADESVDVELPENVARQSSKKAKQMIAQMYNDGDDVFVSSDDEEVEQRLVRQRLLEQTEEQASFVSPVEDENSREVFGLIKKLNIVPDTKKRAKTTSSFFDTLVTGGNSNSSSKSSFLGRSQSSSLPSSHKQGSSVVRSFIFGRDDSNSRNSFSTSERSDMDQKENRPMRNASAKFSSSQSKSTGHSATIKTNASSGTSLFEILRQSSMHSDHCIQSGKQSGSLEIRQSQALYQFTAFKSSKKAIKVESKNLMQES